MRILYWWWDNYANWWLELCWLTSWWWYEMWLRWYYFMIRVDFMMSSWDSHLYDFWWVVCKNSRCWNVLLCLLNYRWVHECDGHMNGESMILQPFMVLVLVMNLWLCMIPMDNNLLLRTIHMCQKELTISFRKICCYWKIV